MTAKTQKTSKTPTLDQSAKNRGSSGPIVSLSPMEQMLVYHLCQDLGRSERPYAEIAEKLGAEEKEILALVKDFKDKGLIRRLGAVVVHQRSGYGANAMVVWSIQCDQIDTAGERLAQFSFVSHCYFRPSVPDWPFSLYTMIHAKDEPELAEMVSEMARSLNNNSYRILTSLRELKKSSTIYFSAPDKGKKSPSRSKS